MAFKEVGTIAWEVRSIRGRELSWLVGQPLRSFGGVSVSDKTFAEWARQEWAAAAFTSSLCDFMAATVWYRVLT